MKSDLNMRKKKIKKKERKKREEKRMAKMKNRMFCAALCACIILQSGMALAASPADGIVGQGPTGTAQGSQTTGQTTEISGNMSTDWWHGYVNENGSAVPDYLEKGTEVSKFQNMNGEINWKKAKAAGLDFVMVRLSYGTTPDAYFEANVKGAQAAGIKVGAYVCSTAKNMNDTLAEAQLTLQKLQGIQLQYPIAYDVEVNSMLSEGATPQDLTNMINSYCKLMQQAGFYPIVYANKNWIDNHMIKSQIPYDFWYAQYPANKVYRPASGVNITIWQSSEKGVIDGIKGNVTTELSWKSYNGSSTAAGPTALSSNVASAANASSDSGVVAKGVTPISGTSGSSAVVGEGPTGSSTSGNTSGSVGVISANGPAQSSSGTSANVSATGNLTPDYSPASDGIVYDGARSGNGWQKNVAGKWNYYQNGKFYTGFLKDTDGRTYYFDPTSCNMVFGWQLINGKWYWFKWDGIMRTGWHLINNQWYYMDEDGTTVQNETRMINGVQYRFDANGAWIG